MKHNRIMDEKELSILVQNEKEWRRMLWKKLEAVEIAQGKTDSRITSLEVKNAFFGSIFGFFAGMIASYINKH